MMMLLLSLQPLPHDSPVYPVRLVTVELMKVNAICKTREYIKEFNYGIL